MGHPMYILCIHVTGDIQNARIVYRALAARDDGNAKRARIATTRISGARRRRGSVGLSILNADMIHFFPPV